MGEGGSAVCKLYFIVYIAAETDEVVKKALPFLARLLHFQIFFCGDAFVLFEYFTEIAYVVVAVVDGGFG